MTINEKLIQYDQWANQLVFDAIHKLESVEALDEATFLFQHLLAAQTIWYNRIRGIENDVNVWEEDTSLEICKEWMRNSHKLLEEIVDLKNEEVNYSSSKADQYSNTVEELFHHIIIHGQHHRAQIARILRQNDVIPPPTDFIFYLRSFK